MCNLNKQELISSNLPYQIYKIKEQTIISDFAKKHKVLIENCIFENPQLKVGEYVIIKERKFKIHIVRPGESIIDISNLYKVSEEAIISNNKVEKIFVGQQLFI